MFYTPLLNEKNSTFPPLVGKKNHSSPLDGKNSYISNSTKGTTPLHSTKKLLIPPLDKYYIMPNFGTIHLP